MGDRWIGLMIGALALLALGSVVNGATIYTVGDSLGWTVPPNNSLNFYEQWSANHTFRIGDSILFNWTGSGTHTVTEVPDEELYKNCTKFGITFASSGLSTLLAENGTRYFICSVGTHCEQGMKLAVKIGDGIPPPPPSASPSLRPVAALLISSIVIILFSYL